MIWISLSNAQLALAVGLEDGSIFLFLYWPPSRLSKWRDFTFSLLPFRFVRFLLCHEQILTHCCSHSRVSLPSWLHLLVQWKLYSLVRLRTLVTTTICSQQLGETSWNYSAFKLMHNTIRKRGSGLRLDQVCLKLPEATWDFQRPKDLKTPSCSQRKSTILHGLWKIPESLWVSLRVTWVSLDVFQIAFKFIHKINISNIISFHISTYIYTLLFDTYLRLLTSTTILILNKLLEFKLLLNTTYNIYLCLAWGHQQSFVFCLVHWADHVMWILLKCCTTITIPHFWLHVYINYSNTCFVLVLVDQLFLECSGLAWDLWWPAEHKIYLGQPTYKGAFPDVGQIVGQAVGQMVGQMVGQVVE